MASEESMMEKDLERLKVQNTLLQSCIESYKDVLIFSIDRQYRYVLFNANFKAATAYAYGTEVKVGISMLDSITDIKDREKAKRNCDRALSGESHVTIEEYGEVNKSYYETRYDPIRDQDQQIIGVNVLSANVTERKQAEEHILALNKELEAFSYTVAHDLRSPLRVINGYSNILVEEKRDSLDPECQRLLKVIADNVKHMGNLIDDLLDFSRLGRSPLNRSMVNMNSLVKSVLDQELTPADHEKFEFRINQLHDLNCDGDLMRQVFSNLISNAVKYSYKKEQPVIEIGSSQGANFVTYFIKDNGAG
ncbi:MAG: sensor histidine kinase, partial [Bacteroidota bacterium]